jgi:hypothetical protein
MLLAQRGVELDADQVDALLRSRVHRVAEMMGISDRTALGYAPDNLPEIIAADVTAAIAADTGTESAADPEQRRARHLRIVE